MWQDLSFGDGEAKRSRTRFVAIICGSTVAWGSKLQSLVALSTAEAEYMALSAATQEVIFLRQLLTNLGEPVKGPTPMYEDNERYEALAINDIPSAKTKHIDICHHFVRDLVKSKAIEIVLISTSEMLADILTKNTLTLENTRSTPIEC